ncbi:putative RiPP precursor [Mesorhizobium sp. ES1-1]|nr:putative RiPP precursor [Mesorhizobium sp. ES1-1]MBZ9675511.1 putative RiPP precursor [Mesorhizobium sp. ES1-1]
MKKTYEKPTLLKRDRLSAVAAQIGPSTTVE